MRTRQIKINDEIARTAAEIIRKEMKDPPVGEVVSVTKAEATTDLKSCKIHVSIVGGEEEREKTMAALANAAGFVRKRIAELVNLRQTPEISFVYDDSIEYGMRMRKLIEEANKGGGENEGNPENPA